MFDVLRESIKMFGVFCIGILVIVGIMVSFTLPQIITVLAGGNPDNPMLVFLGALCMMFYVIVGVNAFFYFTERSIRRECEENGAYFRASSTLKKRWNRR